MKKYVVEAKIYDNGYIDAFIRDAKSGESNHFHRLKNYDLYIDVFNNKADAFEFLNEYKIA